MAYCATHNQVYPQDGYCVYCGPPSPPRAYTTSSSCQHMFDYGDHHGIYCLLCGEVRLASKPAQKATSNEP